MKNFTDLWKSGATTEDICVQYGIAYSGAVKHMGAALGLPQSPAVRCYAYEPWPAQKRVGFLTDHRAGHLSGVDIAKKYNIPAKAVRWVALVLGATAAPQAQKKVAVTGSHTDRALAALPGAYVHPTVPGGFVYRGRTLTWRMLINTANNNLASCGAPLINL